MTERDDIPGQRHIDAMTENLPRRPDAPTRQAATYTPADPLTVQRAQARFREMFQLPAAKRGETPSNLVTLSPRDAVAEIVAKLHACEPKNASDVAKFIDGYDFSSPQVTQHVTSRITELWGKGAFGRPSHAVDMDMVDTGGNKPYTK
jgi:hypothetical protein